MVQSIDPQQKRIVLSHRELLGTWLENAARFRVGETVPGIVRSCKPYGCPSSCTICSLILPV